MKPNSYQKDIYDAVKNSANHLVIEARAGTGKTTTTIESVKLLDPSSRILLCAFNTSIKNELEKRAPSYCEVRTMPSLGYGCLRREGPFKVEGDVASKKIKSIYATAGFEDPGAVSAIARLVSLAKNTLAGDGGDLLELIETFNLDACGESVGHMITIAQSVLDRGASVNLTQKPHYRLR